MSGFEVYENPFNIQDYLRPAWNSQWNSRDEKWTISIWVSSIETIVGKFEKTKSKTEILPTMTYRKRHDVTTNGKTLSKSNRKSDLIYVIVIRSNVVSLVSQLSRVLDCSQETHWNTGIRVLRYLYSIKYKSLQFRPINKLEI